MLTGRTKPALLALLALATFALIAAACNNGGGSSDSGETPTNGDAVADGEVTEITAFVLNSELVAGDNRFMVILLSQDNVEVTGADTAFRFFKLNGEEQELRFEADATAQVVEKTFTEVHEDGTVETHSAGESGVYLAEVSFDEPGEWGVEVTAVQDGESLGPVGAAFSVLEESASVAIGAPAPQSVTLTTADVDDITRIDTSDPPNPDMHAMTIGEAVTSGRPSVIVFATPAFCTSRFCGPAKQAVDGVFEEYRDAVNFVHVEPYDIEAARNGEGLIPVPATEEWGLISEPWVFVVDSSGNVSARFEQFLSEDDLRAALDAALTAG